MLNRYKGIKIGFIGAASMFEVDNVIVNEPIGAIEDVVNNIKGKTDIIILLFV